jgi:hypothetical protein
MMLSFAASGAEMVESSQNVCFLVPLQFPT